MSSYGSTYTNKVKGFELLCKLGATRAEVEFSGGNDEGGVNQITLFFAPAEKGGEPYYEGAEMEYVDGKWREKPKEKMTEEQKLSLLLQEPVDSEFGSWAGEFDAYGTLTWYVVEKLDAQGVTHAAGTCTMDKYIQSTYDHESEEW